MRITGSSFSKGDVFRFADEVKNLIELLNGIVIQSQDKERLNKIIFQKEKIEKMIVFFEPNIYEEYSERVRILYLQMKKAKEEYKNKYDKSVDDYKNGKLIRDKIKEELNKI